MLFIIFIDDIDEKIYSTVLKILDDTNLLAMIGTEKNMGHLRQDLVGLFIWLEDCHMLFSLDKCAVIREPLSSPRPFCIISESAL